jgi:hypothetical protein
MRYEILDAEGNVINTIVADEAFMAANPYPYFREAPEAQPAPAQPSRKLSKLEFINLFTDEEYVGILTAAKQSAAVEAWLKKFEMTSVDADGRSIDLTDPRTIAGVNALEAGGLLAAGRAAEILNGG